MKLQGVKRPRLFSTGVGVLLVGAVIMLNPGNVFASTTQAALPAAISGTQEILLPPCGGQTVHDCVVNASWTSTLLTPDQAAAYYVAVGAASGSFSTCNLIALWGTTITTSSALPLPAWGGSQSVAFYQGAQLMATSIPGYPGSGSTTLVHYSQSDSCGTYDSGVTSTTASKTAASSTSSQTSASASVTTSASSTTSSETTTRTATDVSNTTVTVTSAPGPSGGPSLGFPLLAGGTVSAFAIVILILAVL